MTEDNVKGWQQKIDTIVDGDLGGPIGVNPGAFGFPPGMPAGAYGAQYYRNEETGKQGFIFTSHDTDEVYRSEAPIEFKRSPEEMARAWENTYKQLLKELATPPDGWFTFGTHVDAGDIKLEFWGTDDGGIPIWERPVVHFWDDLDTDVNLAWAAGYLSGRGIINIVRRGLSKRPRIILQGKDEEQPLREFARIMGVEQYVRYMPLGYSKTMTWRLEIERLDILSPLMAKLWPWLSYRIKRQWEDALKQQTNTK